MMKCGNCGKEVLNVCANCWRCKDCGDKNCAEHMKRTINGKIANKSKK